jgi:Putative zinc-finger
MQRNIDNCRVEVIAAYIDGDLEPAALGALEKHLAGCEFCDSELRLQRLFMCELDSAFTQKADLPVPRDFARIVAVQAESDMSGARSGIEHKRALRFCLILALASFALLGVAASKAVLFSGQLIAGKIFGVVGLLGKALYDAGVGMAVILRVAGRALSPDSFSVLVLLVLLLAVLLLSLLISSYHRYQHRRLYE